MQPRLIELTLSQVLIIVTVHIPQILISLKSYNKPLNVDFKKSSFTLLNVFTCANIISPEVVMILKS